MSDNPEHTLDDRLASLERNLKRVEDGLALLGVKPCAWCGVFYRRSDPAALFHGSQFVCFKCITPWWSHRCPELSVADRKTIERELRQWLLSHHNAQVILQPEKLPKPEEMLIKLVTGCDQCDASGKTPGGGRCHHCDGRGTVWVVVRAPDYGSSPE